MELFTLIKTLTESPKFDFTEGPDPKVLKQAYEKVIKEIILNQEYDVPYLAGTSKDGKTIYIDRSVPKTMQYKGKKFKLSNFLIIHEKFEKAFFEEFKFDYNHAHHLASLMEKTWCELNGLDWNTYNNFLKPYGELDFNKKDKKLPPDLNPQPYKDSHQLKLLKNK